MTHEDAVTGPPTLHEWQLALAALRPDGGACRLPLGRGRGHGSVYEAEYRVRRHDGVYRRFLRGAPVLDDGGIR